MPDLLINGPVESIGISGAEAHIEKKLFPKNSIKNFNTIKTVIRMVNTYGNKFDRIIWNITDRNEKDLYEIRKKFQSNSIDIELVCRLAHEENSIYHPRWDGHPLAENNSVKYIKNLIFLLQRSNASNILIIRSDQYMNLDLVDFNINQNFIHVPRIKKSYIEAGDTYLLSARKLLLEKLIFAQENRRGLDDNIHRIFWKAQAFKEKQKYKIPTIFFKLPYPYNVGVWSKNIARYIQSRYIRPMSFEIYKSIEWRGSRYSSEHLNDMRRNYFFKEDYPEQTIIKRPVFKIYIKDIYVFIKASLIMFLKKK